MLSFSGPDAYGRFWDPAGITGTGYSVVARSNASVVNTKMVPDNPPQAIMDNAMTTSNNSARSMKLPLADYLTSSPSPVYMNMYFTELNSTQKRSFTVDVGDKPVQPAKPVTPTYGNVTELSIYNIVAAQNTTFSLVSTANSMLPPIISAIELFFVLNYTQKSPAPYETLSSKSKLPIILGVTIPVVVILMALMAVMVWRHKKKEGSRGYSFY